MPVIKALELAIHGYLRLSGVESLWLPTTMGAIHAYRARGEGSLPKVVCLHGLASSGSSFAPILRRLRARVQEIVAIDLPAHGRSVKPRERLSPRALARAVTDALIPQTPAPALVVGNSLGGALALRFALDHPERVAGVVVASPAGAALSSDEFDDLIASFQFRSVRHGRDFFSKLYHRTPPMASLLAWDLKRTLSQPTLHELVDALDEAGSFSESELRCLRCPVLVVWGREDKLMPGSALDYFIEHLPPHRQVKRLDGVGHSPHVEAPGPFAQQIIDFASSL